MANTSPLYAVVGVTDLAVERVRAAAAQASGLQAQFEARVSAVQADVEKRVTEFDPKSLRAQAQEVPNRAAAFALETASKATVQVETAYEDLTKRGKDLVQRIRTQQATQDLVHQAESTVSRGKAAVTVARKAADDTASAVLSTLNVGKREAAEVVEEARTSTRTAARSAAKKTQASARKTATTTQKKAAATKSAVKGAQTSATKTAAKATTATRAAAKKVGN